MRDGKLPPGFLNERLIRNSGYLVFTNLVINAAGFLRQVIMAWFLGASSEVDLLLLAMIVPAILQAMIGGGAGEILVIRKQSAGEIKSSFETLFIITCLVPVLVAGVIYYLSLGHLAGYYEIDSTDTILFRNLSVLYILSMIPGTFVSILRPMLLLKGLYRVFNTSTMVWQVAGLALILLLVKSYGIYAFALSFLAMNLINAAWFSLRSDIKLLRVFSFSAWKREALEMGLMMKRVANLGIQTLLNRFATFWERSLSVKYLTPGFLSSMNYARTLSELPNSVLISSVLTTSYIEQANLKKTDPGEFSKFTIKSLDVLVKGGFALQLLMLLLAPFIVILVFRRGQFDNDAAYTTLLIFNVFTLGFLPRLVMNFFSRTMYILEEYRRLLLSIFLKFMVHFLLMISLVRFSGYIIPVAAVTGYIFLSIWLYRIIGGKIGLPGIKRFVLKLFAMTIVSAAILRGHLLIFDYLIEKSNRELFMAALPLSVLAGFVFIIYAGRSGLVPGLGGQIISKIWKRKD